MTTPFRAVVVSADPDKRNHLSKILASLAVDCACASCLRECYEILTETRAGLVFCEPILPDGSYEDLLTKYQSREWKPRVVITSDGANWDEFKKATDLGAFDVIAAPCRAFDVEWMIVQAKREEHNHPAQVRVPS